MSLLNDALRAAEQRQQQPTVSGAYTGQSVHAPRSRLPLVVLVIALLVAGAGALWWFLIGPGDQTVPGDGNVAQETAPAESARTTAAPEVETVTEEPPVPAAQKPEPEKAANEQPINPQVALSSSEEKRAPEPVAGQPPKAVPAEVPKTAPAPQPEPRQTPASAEPDPEPVAVVRNSDQPTETGEPEFPPTGEKETSQPIAEVKQQRETPEAIDRRTRKELKELLASGRTLDAERRLEVITARQAAPGSREIFAREMLVQDSPERALTWLPESVTVEHAGLRLLRARAQLAQGHLEQAVATLESRVPPVDGHVEYRVTLATLLQQAGQAELSAGHWSELIAYDDSRAAWWLGLAIALESGGRTRSAVRAYAQAATMPGLSESLTEYARARLRALQAES